LQTIALPKNIAGGTYQLSVTATGEKAILITVLVQ